MSTCVFSLRKKIVDKTIHRNMIKIPKKFSFVSKNKQK